MALFCVFTRLEAPKFAKLVLWLLDLPKRGVQQGGAIRLTIADTAPNPCPKALIGWTTRHVDVIAKPGNTGADTDSFAFRVTAELQAAWQLKKDQLTQAQRDFVNSHLASASDLVLDPAWLSLVNGAQVLLETDDVVPEP